MSDWKMEEMYPLIAELTRKYTGLESTSVTYETANKLMGALIYCINEYEKSCDKATLDLCGISLRKKYEIGLDFVIKKIRDTQQKYNELMTIFDSYGNKNYADTVVSGISGFFLYYDYRFHPQDSIITFDYPTIPPIFNSGESGIDLVSRYVQYIEIEQRFLLKMPREFVVSILDRYDGNYTEQFYNISVIILRHVLCCAFIQKNSEKPASEKDYQNLFYEINKLNREELQEKLEEILHELLQEFYEGSENLFCYFAMDIKEFVEQMKEIKDIVFLCNVVVL